jgi:hypothetical protein
MKLSPSFRAIEPLEARIAPANVFVGAFGAGETTLDTEYVEAGPALDPSAPQFVKTLGGSDPISQAVDGGANNTYYLKLEAGDTLFQFFPGNGYQSLINVTSGTVVAFFVDGGQLNESEPGELKGIALGTKVKAQISAPVDGDILTIYNDQTGGLDLNPTTDIGGLNGPKQTIGDLTIGGSVNGGIYSGGAITKLTVQGNVQEILTGKAANGRSFDLFTGALGGEGTLNIAPTSGEAGGSITNVRVGSVGLIEAGGGGAGGKGGVISQLQVLQDSDGMIIKAGSGGNGVAGKPTGGLGGDVTKVYVSGFTDPTANDTIQILAGDGGVAALGGKGGAGGKATNVFVGFDLSANVAIPSGPFLFDNVEVASGKGGDGKVGGVGGALTNVKIRAVTPDSADPLVTELVVRAGNGGAAVENTGGAAGAGGSVSLVDVRNQQNLEAVAFDSDILVRAGNGGLGNPNSNGAAGGSVTSVTLLGFNAEVFAGNGSEGKQGGKGGALSKLDLLQSDNILAHTLRISAGSGGKGDNGNGGIGGNVSAVRVLSSDLSELTINGGTGANGGIGVKGKGGLGGSVSDISITDVDTGFQLSGGLSIRTGNGGDGDSGGGKAGDLSRLTFFGQDLTILATSGIGGNAVIQGNGGAGGIISAVNFTADGQFQGLSVDGTITAGFGGAGAGKGGGGAGGDIRTVNINVDGDARVTAGDGGNGTALKAAGRGGSITSTGAFARDGEGVMAAGDAGEIGGKAAAGGSVLGGGGAQLSAMRANIALRVTGGDGSGGGAGGNILGLAFGSTADSLSPTPSGDILIQAGDGSGVAKTVGKGGSIDRVDGNASSGENKFTRILAGDGGGSPLKSALGGSITNVNITGVGDDQISDNRSIIVVEAGHGGDTASGKSAAKGGDVKNLAFTNLDPQAIVRSVAAGDGGDAALGKGGAGGSIDNARIIGGLDAFTDAILSADFGFRSGQNYGYETMGGLFAGAAGASSPGKPSIAGSVTNISADSIAVIVAGRAAAPQYAEIVKNITLNGLNRLTTSSPSPFTVTYGDPGVFTTSLLPGDATPNEVEQEINDTDNPDPAVPDVDVTRTQTASYQIVNRETGDIQQFSGEENVPVFVTEESSGGKDFMTTETVPGSTVTSEEQYYKPFTNGTYQLRFGPDEQPNYTGDIPFNASAADVQTELNNLPRIIEAGGVTVTGDEVTGYTVRFLQNGVREPIFGTANVQETQIVDVLGVGDFSLTGEDGTTPRLNENATAAEVDTALDAVVPGGVTVVDGPAGSSSYIVTFNEPGDQDLLAGSEYIPLANATTSNGTAASREVQTLSFVSRQTFTPGEYAIANIVGAIADPNEINSPVFKYIDVDANNTFNPGDRPIDGLVMAKVFDQTTVNFTPEAKLVAGVFFDHNNKL